jgi:hypothetical protein
MLTGRRAVLVAEFGRNVEHDADRILGLVTHVMNFERVKLEHDPAQMHLK